MRSSRATIVASLLLLVSLAGCDRGSSTVASDKIPVPDIAKVTVTRAPYGTLADGTAIEAFTITNAAGASVTAITYGAIVTSIKVPDREGKLADVVLGHDSLDGYLKEGSYFGATVGRYANRIGGAQFGIDGQTYKLAANNGENSLHGGLKGFDKVVWHPELVESADGTGVKLKYVSPDGEEGYPGTLNVAVTYTFNDKGEFAIGYQATTDKATIVNLTNHSYFNLGGDGSGDVLATELTINADQYTLTDDQLIPTGELANVEGTPLDFRTATPIGARIQDERLKRALGYDNNFVITRNGAELASAARAEDPRSGRTLEVFTTEPGVQLYTANHQNGTVGKSGRIYNQYGAFCLETQHYPDSPNKPTFPTTTLRPGETFKSKTVYAFGVRAAGDR
jgi:aldose 1-epimerase